jgi:hypothetical protein
MANPPPGRGAHASRVLWLASRRPVRGIGPRPCRMYSARRRIRHAGRVRSPAFLFAALRKSCPWVEQYRPIARRDGKWVASGRLHECRSWLSRMAGAFSRVARWFCLVPQPANRVPGRERDVPHGKRGTAGDKRDVPGCKRGFPAGKRGTPTAKRCTPKRFRDAPERKRGTPKRFRDTVRTLENALFLPLHPCSAVK